MPLGLNSFHCAVCREETIHKKFTCIHCGTVKAKDARPADERFMDDCARYGKPRAVSYQQRRRQAALAPAREAQRRERVAVPEADFSKHEQLRSGRERTRC